MLTYHVRQRRFKLSAQAPALAFPARCHVSAVLQPSEAFGMGAGRSRTAIRAVAASLYFDVNTGHHYVEQAQKLLPLQAAVDSGGDVAMKVEGNTLTMSFTCASLPELEDIVHGLYYVYPMMLNLNLPEPPFVERIFGKIGDRDFRWELSDWVMRVETTTQEKQQDHTVAAWLRLGTVHPPERRRLLGALHYFHVACRLSRAGYTPWEFMPEVLLNLSKVLEVLFPSFEQGSIDAARTGLRLLGYNDFEIERDFIPALALRNAIDVGHVQLAIFTQPQLQVLHSYSEAAEWNFRNLLRKLVDMVERDEYRVIGYGDSSPSKEAVAIIERMAAHQMERRVLEPEGKATPPAA